MWGQGERGYCWPELVWGGVGEHLFVYNLQCFHRQSELDFSHESVLSRLSWAASWSNSRSFIWDSAISGGAEWRYVCYIFFKVDYLALSLLFLLTFLPFFYLRVAAF
jgi:hypothetical protein